MELIDRCAQGIALIINERHHLIATVTDGDIRRAVLAGMDLDLPVTELLNQRQPAFDTGPLTAAFGTSDAALLHLMTENGVRHIPLVDEHSCVVDIAILNDIVKEYELPLRAVVMAGGYASDSIGEDFELIVRMHHRLREARVPYRIRFVPDPVCWTEVPESLRVLQRQRNRWQRASGPILTRIAPNATAPEASARTSTLATACRWNSKISFTGRCSTR
jgi:cellulose synthase/poly-beta-1,6-N-acetylglucosamine synthase-like glycosyltransferase